MYARLQHLADLILRSAIENAPPEIRDRVAEEWTADMAMWSMGFSKLSFALSLRLRGVAKLRREQAAINRIEKLSVSKRPLWRRYFETVYPPDAAVTEMFARLFPGFRSVLVRRSITSLGFLVPGALCAEMVYGWLESTGRRPPIVIVDAVHAIALLMLVIGVYLMVSLLHTMMKLTEVAREWRARKLRMVLATRRADTVPSPHGFVPPNVTSFL